MSKHYVVNLHTGSYILEPKDIAALMEISTRARAIKYNSTYTAKQLDEDQTPFVEAIALEEVADEPATADMHPSPRPSF